MKKILVIEDEKSISDNLRDLLRLHNYDVSIASNGLEGFNKAQQVHPDIIISDIRMPVMDGYELMEKIRAIPVFSNIPFIFITAKIERADLRKGMDLGADDYITKPFKAEELLASIKTRLARHEIQQTPVEYAQEKVSEVKNALDTLTKTEKQILMLVAEGMDNKTLSDKLFVSKRTIEKHRANILEKLHLGGNNGLLRFVSLHKNLINSLVTKD